MQTAPHQPIRSATPAPDCPPTYDPADCPAAMARFLRRTNGEAALCFARAMHDGSAWANEGWGSYWADVMRLV